MEKNYDCGLVFTQKKRRMRNNRKKRRRQQRAIMKHQAASEALAEKIAVSVRKQKALTEKYAEKWRKTTQEAKLLKGQLHRQTHIRQVIVHCTLDNSIYIGLPSPNAWFPPE